ncbi:MAG: hypothetical protein CVV52_05140 [Spirochaetae bacterium HGW-Spirochaetae-8]|nr:MAG: hypothetical protein CVV52_05140 [Spirochaetae bacterium HGW-Spirochaetae-8]
MIREDVPLGGAAIFAVSMLVIAALVFCVAGIQMVSIQSMGGNTIAEVYYRAMGLGMFGFSALCLGAAGFVGNIADKVARITAASENIESFLRDKG